MVMSLFYLLLSTLSLNLGFHQVYRFSYVSGILVDYFIPTLYFQDILVFLLVLSFFLYKNLAHEKRFFDHESGLKSNKIRTPWSALFLILYLVSTGLSVVSSQNVGVSIYLIARLFLYSLFAFLLPRVLNLFQSFSLIMNIFIATTFLLSLLGMLQIYHQGSLFDNYLFFGEQPYSYSTLDIAKESFLGETLVPPYGLFRHPNIFAGYLSVILLWLIGYFLGWQKYMSTYAKATLGFAILLALLTLLSTFSFHAIFSLLFVLIILFISRYSGQLFSLKTQKRLKLFLFVSVIALFVMSLVGFYFFSGNTFLENFPSVYRRLNLLSAMQMVSPERYLFGLGYGTSPELTSFVSKTDFRVAQPIHNIFGLAFVESGIFAFFFLFLFFICILYESLSKRGTLFSLALLQLFILGFFDHYIFTIHQTQLLFWLTVSFYFAYNYYSDVFN